MKTKFLSIIVGLFATSFVMTSCLSTTDPVSYEVDGTLKAFSFDSIKVDKSRYVVGRKHPFSIQQNGENATSLVYNANLLPVNTDLKKVKVNMSTSGYVTYLKEGKETAWNSTDTLDFTSPIDFTITAYNSDGSTVKRIYKVSFNKYSQDPDSLNWGTSAYANNTGVVGKHKSVIYNGKVYTFQDNNGSQLRVSSSAETDGATWAVLIPMTGIPVKADYSSITVFNGKLYILADGNVYVSTDAVNWSKQDGLSTNIKQLLISFDGKLAATKELNGVLRFCVTTNGTSWVDGDEVPVTFPVRNTSATSYPLKTNTNIKTAILVGETSAESTVAVPWSTFDGKSWADLKYEKRDATSVDYSCPIAKNVSIIYYNNKLYTFGGQGASSFEAFYTSEEGIIWKKVTEKVRFPSVFKGREGYSYVIDRNNFIWMIWGGAGSAGADNLWKGRLNSLGFPAQ